MSERTFREIELEQLKPNPWNRKGFNDPEYNSLVESIRAKGVIVPIMVRPAKGKKKESFEIIAGERRYQASCEIAKSNGGMKGHKIPALIQEMSDDEAFDVTTIENLQRKNLTELEEAQIFKAYVDRHGKESLDDLASRCSINPGYIRRRIHVLELPKDILKAWEQGKIKYGHCEQLARLFPDEKTVKVFFKDLIKSADYCQNNGEVKTVRELKRDINQRTIKLSAAKFDLESEGCTKCYRNTSVQAAMFDDLSGLENESCLDPACFKQKQGAFLEANWKKHAKAQRTNGFKFEGELEWGQHNDFENWTGSPSEKCFECSRFISIVSVDGKLKTKQSCIGKKDCFNDACRTSKAQKRREEKNEQSAGALPGNNSEGPRVAWHGNYFREIFYHERIPAVLKELDPDHVFILRVSLFSILKSNSDYRKAFALNNELIKPGDYHNLSLERAWQYVSGLDESALKREMQAAAIAIVLQSEYTNSMLHMISDHIGIDLGKEWKITDEYLQKKTIAEMMDMGTTLFIFEDKKALAFLEEKLFKKAGRFNTCSKKELVSVFLESGVDLTGRVPDEILDIKQNDSSSSIQPSIGPDCDEFDAEADDASCRHLNNRDCEGIQKELVICCCECSDLDVCADRCPRLTFQEKE